MRSAGRPRGTHAGARPAGLCRARVDRSLVVSWLNRGTLHLVRAEDHGWLHAITAPRIRTGNARRLKQEGVSATQADHGVVVIERTLTRDGPCTRAQIGEHLAAAGVPVAGQALVHLLVRATIDGVVVRGPVVGAEQAFVLTRDWLGPPADVDLDAAVVELCRRYLVGHAPADERDVAIWAGLPLGVIRAGLRATRPIADDVTGGLVPRGWVPSAAEPPPPRLLGSFDPVLHGWRERSWVLGDRTDVVTLNGIFRPIALVGGRAVGTWTLPANVVTLRPFAPLDDEVTAALTTDASDVVRYLGRRPGSRALVVADP